MSLCEFSSDTHTSSFMVIETAFINDYLPLAPDSCVKVYLYGLHLCSSPNSSLNSIENIMHTLSMTAGEVKDAFLYWQGEGLVQIIENTSTNQLAIKYLPIHKKLGGAKKFQNKYEDFNSQAQALISTRMITPSEYNEYYTLIESFHFDQDALIAIINYCVKLKGTSVGYPYIVTVAKEFANNGDISSERVVERLSAHNEISSETLNILKIFKPSSKFSTVEDRSLYLKWTSELGFSHNVIREVAKDLKTKNGNMQKLDKSLISYYNANLTTTKEIQEFNDTREGYISLAKAINRNLGVYYENLDVVIETYIMDWIRRGYDEETLKTLSIFCMKKSIRTLEGLNTLILKLYKLGLVTQESINQYISSVSVADGKIQELLDSFNILRSVNSHDREAYNTWTNTWGMSDEIIKVASEPAKDKDQPIQYMNKILASLYDNKIFDAEKAKEYVDNFSKSAKNSKNSSSQKTIAKFEQREYNQNDLNALFDNLDNIEI